jgi:uncharacterized protein YbdZ (MbtH family)
MPSLLTTHHPSEGLGRKWRDVRHKCTLHVEINHCESNFQLLTRDYGRLSTWRTPHRTSNVQDGICGIEIDVVNANQSINHRIIDTDDKHFSGFSTWRTQISVPQGMTINRPGCRRSRQRSISDSWAGLTRMEGSEAGRSLTQFWTKSGEGSSKN